MLQIRVSHLLSEVVGHGAHARANRDDENEPRALAPGAEVHLRIGRRLGVNHRRHLPLGVWHHRLELLSSSLITQNACDGARDADSHRSLPVVMIGYFLHRLLHALHRQLIEIGGHARPVKLSIRGVHQSSLCAVHPNLHSEDYLSLGIVPASAAVGGEQNISSRCSWDIFGAGLWVDRRGAPLTYPKASSQPLAYDYQVSL